VKHAGCGRRGATITSGHRASDQRQRVPGMSPDVAHSVPAPPCDRAPGVLRPRELGLRIVVQLHVSSLPHRPVPFREIRIVPAAGACGVRQPRRALAHRLRSEEERVCEGGLNDRGTALPEEPLDGFHGWGQSGDVFLGPQHEQHSTPGCRLRSAAPRLGTHPASPPKDPSLAPTAVPTAGTTTKHPTFCIELPPSSHGPRSSAHRPDRLQASSRPSDHSGCARRYGPRQGASFIANRTPTRRPAQDEAARGAFP
jgi:hypothetical protein